MHILTSGSQTTKATVAKFAKNGHQGAVLTPIYLSIRENLSIGAIFAHLPQLTHLPPIYIIPMFLSPYMDNLGSDYMHICGKVPVQKFKKWTFEINLAVKMLILAAQDAY